MLLAIDTSNKTLAVALVDQSTIVGETIIENTLQHSTQLMPTIEELLKASQTNIKAIDKIVVAQGPGSYTGLRIGITVAKTLAVALKKPLVAVSSLAVIAGNCPKEEVGDRLIIPFFDARRKNIFTGAYQYDAKGHLVEALPERHISLATWLEYLAANDEAYYFVGKLPQECYEEIKDALGEKVSFATAPQAIPSAQTLALLGQNQAPVDAHTFVPVYLKLAEAEEVWLAKNPDSEVTTYVERI
ncbi:tRNA threonylcarbamoyladenosine biosynthesis protein TsaB [Granulicatella balaenopterae]|uniref:tRNA threonylcarbamoyladenosine biosynthesis protein TsaB n=1 Tax=Granulicatella balaenopterae TaxID=137733 RepID=A0A1H9JM69_9LACT|nr:tRNA (adenosine(37)-N6)-threonylcarbamoyltransferase complex dimerization subunit type 1 TsaB [Granulicatella balaenopterae]SEQ87962.1 tRNA threonylcarbamoyladenosine biosynthesis protein TsaB [Granulicatella balaenopterae]